MSLSSIACRMSVLLGSHHRLPIWALGDFFLPAGLGAVLGSVSMEQLHDVLLTLNSLVLADPGASHFR